MSNRVSPSCIVYVVAAGVAVAGAATVAVTVVAGVAAVAVRAA